MKGKCLIFIVSTSGNFESRGNARKRVHSCRVMFQRVFPRAAAEARLWSLGPCHTLRDLSITTCTSSAFRTASPGGRTHGDTSGPPGVVTSNLSAGWCPSFLQHAHGRVWRKVVTLGRSTPSASWGRFRGATNRDSRQTSSVLAGLGQCEEETKPVGGDRTGRGYLTSGDRL